MSNGSEAFARRAIGFSVPIFDLGKLKLQLCEKKASLDWRLLQKWCASSSALVLDKNPEVINISNSLRSDEFPEALQTICDMQPFVFRYVAGRTHCGTRP